MSVSKIPKIKTEKQVLGLRTNERTEEGTNVLSVASVSTAWRRAREAWAAWRRSDVNRPKMHQIASGRRAFVLAAIVVLLALLSLAVKPTLTTTRDASDERLNTTDMFQSRRSLLPVLSCRHPPRVPPASLTRSTYAASFPGSGDKIITQYLVEGMTGMFVGESNLSPSMGKGSQTNNEQVRSPVSQATQQVSSPQSSQGVPPVGEPVMNEQAAVQQEAGQLSMKEQSDKTLQSILGLSIKGNTRRVLRSQDPDKSALDTELRQQEVSEERLQENTEISGSTRPQGEVILVRSQFPHTSGKLVRVIFDL